MLKFCVILVSVSTTIFGGLAANACSCDSQNQSLMDSFQKQEVQAALRSPSEVDRSIARSFRMKGISIDAGQYYRSAAEKAGHELSEATAKLKQNPPDISVFGAQQIAIHSTAVEHEAASYLEQLGDATAAATILERAVDAQVAASKPSIDLATEYGAVARLYETAKQPSKAAEMYKKQIELLQTTKGRYSPEANFAAAEYRRITRNTQQASLSSRSR